MKRRIVSLSVLVIFAMCFLGCGHVKIKPDALHDSATQEFLLQEAGYNASYWVLKNNPNYIERTEAGLQGIDGLLDAGDIAEAVRAAIAVVVVFRDIDPNYLPLISSATRLLSAILKIDTEGVENFEQAKTLVQAFLTGAEAGVADAKLQLRKKGASDG